MSQLILGRDYFTQPNVVELAQDLLGKVLVTSIDGQCTSGIICETEAYNGISDRASHAFGGRRTARTEIMYRIGGTAYIYLCYGVHSLFNVVTNVEGVPHAILIRGIIPAEGKEIMAKRRRTATLKNNSGIGPGKVSQLLGIHYSLSGVDLTLGPKEGADSIWIEDRNIRIPVDTIITSPRIGVDYAGEDALLPYRFRVT